MPVVLSVEESALTEVCMHEPCKSDDISCKNAFSVKETRPSKVESYLEVNTLTDCWQRDLIVIYDQDLAYWTHYSVILHWICCNHCS